MNKDVMDEDIKHKPVITISRQSGSGGLLVARALQKLLGRSWKIWDKEILDEVARVARVRRELIEPIDEREVDFFEVLTRSILGMEVMETSTFYRHLVRAVLSIGKHGNAVIVGRGGNFILPWAYRVRIIASLPVRMERMVKYEHMDKKGAETKLKEWDRERKVFIRSVFDRNIDYPWHYDLIINTDRTDVEQAARLIAQTYRSAF